MRILSHLIDSGCIDSASSISLSADLSLVGQRGYSRELMAPGPDVTTTFYLFLLFYFFPYFLPYYSYLALPCLARHQIEVYHLIIHHHQSIIINQSSSSSSCASSSSSFLHDIVCYCYHYDCCFNRVVFLPGLSSSVDFFFLSLFILTSHLFCSRVGEKRDAVCLTTLWCASSCPSRRRWTVAIGSVSLRLDMICLMAFSPRCDSRFL